MGRLGNLLRISDQNSLLEFFRDTSLETRGFFATPGHADRFQLPLEFGWCADSFPESNLGFQRCCISVQPSASSERISLPTLPKKSTTEKQAGSLGGRPTPFPPTRDRSCHPLGEEPRLMIQRRWKPRPRDSSTVHHVAATAPHDQDTQSTVLNGADHAAIPYPMTPQLTQWTGQRLAQEPRVLQSGNQLVQVIDNASSHLRVELAKLGPGGFRVLDRSSQGHSSRWRRSTRSLCLDEGAPVRPRRGSSPPCL